MCNAGMNGVRINTAYGGISQYESSINTVREITDIPVVLDIKGPEVRIKTPEPKVVKKGETLEVGFGTAEVCFNHDLYDEISVNDTILIDNGTIRTHVVEEANRKLVLKFLTKGVIEDGKGVNICNKRLCLPTLSEKDIEIVKMAKKLEVEYIALSFTRNAQDVKSLTEKQRFEGGVIAKIENFEGVQNVEEILDAATGLMVARGDLGVEIEPEKVPLVQKSLIKQCNQRGKLVVTATEMLESMIHQPIPTRAEVSDVANAILDGTDTVMLSGETAVGAYPVEVVKMVSKIANEAEKAVKSNVEDMAYNKVVTLTRSGYTARMIARFKISQPIIAVTPNMVVKKQLELVFGVEPVLIDYLDEKDRIFHVANQLCKQGMLNERETVLFTSAMRTTVRHASNSIEIHKMSELEKSGSE
jgi:pyruvate kinase